MIRPIGKRKRNCRDFWLSLRKVLSQKLHCDDCCRQTSLLEGNVTATLTNDGTVVSTKLNPLHHSTEHVGQYYTVPINDVSVLFSHGLPKSGYLDEMNTIGEFNLMIRKPALTILNALNIEEKRVKRIVIYGEDGCGKTLTLSHVIHNCYLKEWILLLLPSVFKMIHGRQNVIPSIYNPKRFDQTEVALTWLKSFQILNERFLSKIKTTKEYKISQKISIDTGSSIINVIDQAFHRPNFASDAVGITLKEVQCLSNRIPVLFAADEFNGLFWQTSLKNPENNERLKNKDLSLVKHFVKLFREDSSLAKGSYVVALSRTGMERSFCPSYHYSDLLRPKGLSTLGYFDPVNVPAYDEEELQKCLTYYHKKEYFQKRFLYRPDIQGGGVPHQSSTDFSSENGFAILNKLQIVCGLLASRSRLGYTRVENISTSNKELQQSLSNNTLSIRDEKSESFRTVMSTDGVYVSTLDTCV